MKSGQRSIVPLSVLLCSICSISGNAEKPCFAFLLHGDLTISCDGRTTRITHRGDLEGFAVSDKQSTLAYTTERITGYRKGAAVSTITTTLVDLSRYSSRTAEGGRAVLSTCGGIYSFDATEAHMGIRDLQSGEPLSFHPYQLFRCSTDQRTVVGTAKGLGGDLYEGVPPRIRVTPAGSYGAYQFNISPDGSKVAYLNRRLCVFSSGATQCVKSEGNVTGTPSVNNSGEVLISIATDQECFYRSPYNFSPNRFPGATDESRDECLAIGYWSGGSGSISIIQPLGRDPQWIDSGTAELLTRRSTESAPKEK